MVEWQGDSVPLPEQKPIIFFDVMSQFGFIDRLRILFRGRIKQSGIVYSDLKLKEGDRFVVGVKNVWIGSEPNKKHGDSFCYAASECVDEK